jgi:hypothetical protein
MAQFKTIAVRKTIVEWYVFAGIVALYFALQLWILPKLGIAT